MAKVIKTLGFVLTLICLSLIVYLSFKKSTNMSSFMLTKDKIAHALAYIALSFFFFCSFCRPIKAKYFSKNFLYAIVACILSFIIGYAIEIFQPYFGRTFDFKDLVADAIGSILGSVMALFCVYFICLVKDKKQKEMLK